MDRQPRIGAQHLGDLRSEHRRRHHDVGSWSVGDDLSISQHDDAVGEVGHELDIVSGHDDRVAGTCKVAE